MQDDKLCVFCGQKPGIFQDTTIWCGNTLQTVCKACEKELKGLKEEEICRRALLHGLAVEPDIIKNRITLLTEAESHRPACLRCGGKMYFLEDQDLDNTPYQNPLLVDLFRVLPAFCESCGKYEFYNPTIVRKNKYLAHLIWKDTQE